MNYMNPIYGVFCLLVAWLFAYAISYTLPFFVETEQSSSTKRYTNLDGLRGWLAILVVMHHSSVYYYFFTQNQWNVPSPALYTLSGACAVDLFFQLSGFLFWSICIHTKGKFRLWPFIRERFLRLVPLYIFCLAVCFAIAAIYTHGEWPPSLESFIHELLKWGTIGIIGGYDSSRPLAMDIGGVHEINSSVWTLRYEIMFYVTLPLLSKFCSLRFFPILFIILIGIVEFPKAVMLHNNLTNFGRIHNFTLGMAAAWLIAVKPSLPFLRSRFTSTAIITFVASISFFDVVYTNTTLRAFAMSVLMIPFVYGNTLFGLLTNRPARLLGKISYSSYLLHSPIIFSVINIIGNGALVSMPIYWSILYLTQIIIYGVSLITYRWIELPAMQLARRSGSVR